MRFSICLLLLVATSLEMANGWADTPIRPLPFTRAELLSRNIRDTYRGNHLDRVAFPLGGIGTGCISLAGTGKLVDWEIFNKPNKGYQPRQTFLSVWVREEGEAARFKVLEGQLRERLDGPMYLTPEMFQEGNGVGPQSVQGAGFPRMRECHFQARFPFAQVHLQDERLPITAVIEGWSPFIPGNDRETSLPVAILYVTLTNASAKHVEVALGFNLQNRAGETNEVIRKTGLQGLYLHDGQPRSRSMFAVSTEPLDSWIAHWPADDQFMVAEHFARTFCRHGRYDENIPPENPRSGHAKESRRIGSIGFSKQLTPGGSWRVPIVIGWYFPVFDTGEPHELGQDVKPWRNYYAMEWSSGLEVAEHVLHNLERLEASSRKFQESFFSSTMPGHILEGISANLSVLRSPTIIRYPDGTLYGWEGCAVNRRLGFGTCNHVWNYQQAIPFLFPALQRTIHENFYNYGLREDDGCLEHRMPLGPGATATRFHPAADGQLGMVSQVYREWQISGDTAWLRQLWPRVRKSLEYAWVAWDTDRDGLMEGDSPNTLDLKFTTPETMTGSQYQAALLAGEAMALALGEKSAAIEFRRVFESGKRLSDERLFNGEYYTQLLPAPGDFQLGEGSVCEQLHGQLYCRINGLQDAYDPQHIRKALASVFKYHYRDSFYDVINVNRAYAVGDDRGLLIATWPRGGRPVKPVLYCDETQAGYEYQVAGNLLYAGYLLEGLTVFKSIRDRYDGQKRNPFCEFEWGNHYARSLANYNALLALSRFRYSALGGRLEIDPQVYVKDFRTFFSVEGGWGVVSQQRSDGLASCVVELAQGSLNLRELALRPGFAVHRAEARCGDTKHAVTTAESAGLVTAIFTDRVEVRPDTPLRILLSGNSSQAE